MLETNIPPGPGPPEGPARPLAWVSACFRLLTGVVNGVHGKPGVCTGSYLETFVSGTGPGPYSGRGEPGHMPVPAELRPVLGVIPSGPSLLFPSCSAGMPVMAQSSVIDFGGAWMRVCPWASVRTHSCFLKRTACCRPRGVAVRAMWTWRAGGQTPESPACKRSVRAAGRAQEPAPTFSQSITVKWNTSSFSANACPWEKTSLPSRTIGSDPEALICMACTVSSRTRKPESPCLGRPNTVFSPQRQGRR